MTIVLVALWSLSWGLVDRLAPLHSTLRLALLGLLASVITRSDHPIAGRHVWEHNNLAQKNLTVVDLLPNAFIILPVTVTNWHPDFKPRFALEVIRLRESAAGAPVKV